MVGNIRTYAALVILVALLVITAVLGSRGGIASNKGPVPPEPRVNRIAYVGLDGQIKAVLPNGSDPWQISQGDGFFTWPTWSPDARKLVYSGVVEAGFNERKISLHLFDAVRRTSREIFAGEPGVATLLAEGVVHYPLWSPDSSRVAFIAGTSQGLTLFIDDLGEDVSADAILDNGPLWISWSPDSRYLLAHRAEDHFLVNAAESLQVSNLNIPFIGYRVAAWKPSGSTITFVQASEQDGISFYEGDVIGDSLDSLRRIRGVSPNPAFLWSPDGAYLAAAGANQLLLYQGLNIFIYQDLTLYPEGDAKQPIRIQDNVVAYFWSPDGSKLAYVTLSDTRGVLRWMVLDTADGSRWKVVDFVPTSEQLTMFQFFDQYAYSHSLWSPDSRALVFAGTLDEDAVTASFSYGSSIQGPHILVTGIEPDSLPLVIADGILGFWSPR
ncbi:MAG: PD40 domain-containing protein [Chloroflexi bacterium]|nr:PD40 domain-containing protein [Chloroflexota bacterium]